ncbi:Os02g0651500, partial [Oryza sativa Japonica Group]
SAWQMMLKARLVSHNIRSCRLRAFALPGLRANAANSFLGCLMQCNTNCILFKLLFCHFYN